MKRDTSWFRLVELIILFVIMPLVYVADVLPVHKLIPLAGLFVYCVAWLLINKSTNADRFHLDANWKFIIIRFLVITAMVFLLIRFVLHVNLFADLQKNRKLFYMIVMYPLLSALPQELIFREFFFHRYSTLLKSPEVLLVLNVVLFAFAHLYFESWIVILFTLVGGTIFALTYRQTKSLLVVSIEHTLYGLMVLSSGLGEYFYKAF